METLTGKQRMLNAYQGIQNDRIAIAPEFWYYYPAKLLGQDMITFQRETPFHLALKTTFETFGCEGWGIAFPSLPAIDAVWDGSETWVDENVLETREVIHTPYGKLSSVTRFDRHEPCWALERPIKDFEEDIRAFEYISLEREVEELDPASLLTAREDVGESYLLEVYIGNPFFDWYANSRDGGMEAAVYDFMEYETELLALREKYIDYLRRFIRTVCAKTPFESFFMGCSWSCNSLIGPEMWRKWDKPVIAAAVEETHACGRLLHLHFHGKCMDTVADFAEIGVDCVCPFERPPGGDVKGVEDLRAVSELLLDTTTMNGNVHTVETLIRGTPADVRREVREIMDAFCGNPRVIMGTGDQVGYETPEENLHAMIEEAKIYSAKCM